MLRKFRAASWILSCGLPVLRQEWDGTQASQRSRSVSWLPGNAELKRAVATHTWENVPSPLSSSRQRTGNKDSSWTTASAMEACFYRVCIEPSLSHYLYFQSISSEDSRRSGLLVFQGDAMTNCGDGATDGLVLFSGNYATYAPRVRQASWCLYRKSSPYPTTDRFET